MSVRRTSAACPPSLQFCSPFYILSSSINFQNFRMLHNSIAFSLSFLCLFLVPGCDQGLAPESASNTVTRPHGISGMIHFRNWPPQDSVVDLRLVSFKGQPSQNLVSDVLNGKAKYTATLLPYGADSISYTLLLAPLAPGTFAYTAVAQQYGPNLYTDWRAVGVYHAPNDTTRPGAIFVPPDSVVRGINITVDFQHPPPTP